MNIINTGKQFPCVFVLHKILYVVYFLYKPTSLQPLKRRIDMTKKLFVSAIAKFTAGVVLIGALIFAPAGTLHYPQGWLFMAILFVPMFALCRSTAGKRLSFPHHRSAGKPKGYRHRPLRHCAPPYVYGNNISVPFNAAGAWLSVFLCDFPCLSADYCKKNKGRRTAAGKRAYWLQRIQNQG